MNQPTQIAARPVVRLKESSMSDILIFVAVFGVWFALQAWVLPRYGVST
jgi:hypothetical protein